MTRVDKYIEMLQEYYYKKNGKYNTIEFLKYMIDLLKKTYEYEWEESDGKYNTKE